MYRAGQEHNSKVIAYVGQGVDLGPQVEALDRFLCLPGQPIWFQKRFKVLMDTEESQHKPFWRRPVGKKLMDALKPGDELIIARPVDFGGSVKDCWAAIHKLWQRTVYVSVADMFRGAPLCIDTTTRAIAKKLMLAQLGKFKTQIQSRGSRAGMQRAKAAGIHCGRGNPIGFKVDADGKLKPDRSERYWVRWMTDEVEKGRSVLSVHKELARRRIKTASGIPWGYRRCKRAVKEERNRRTNLVTVRQP